MTSRKLTRKFAATVAVNRANEGAPEKSALQKREARGYAAKTKGDFLKEVSKRLELFAEEMPVAYKAAKGVEDIVLLPAKIRFNKASLSVRRGPKPAFGIEYNDLRQLPGMRQIINMAKAADIGLSVQLFDFSAQNPSRHLNAANEPTPRGSLNWSMKGDAGFYTGLYITAHPDQKFDAKQFPKSKQPKP